MPPFFESVQRENIVKTGVKQLWVLLPKALLAVRNFLGNHFPRHSSGRVSALSLLSGQPVQRRVGRYLILSPTD